MVNVGGRSVAILGRRRRVAILGRCAPQRRKCLVVVDVGGRSVAILGMCAPQRRKRLVVVDVGGRQRSNHHSL